MVQRKSPDLKAGVTPCDTDKSIKTKNYVKSEKIKRSSAELKSLSSSSSSSKLDYSIRSSKSGAGDLKKIMKKSGSFKRSSDFDNLASPCYPVRSSRPKSSATHHKLSSIKSSNGSSPNYMKSTTSSAARKESLQVNACSDGSRTSSNVRVCSKVSSLKALTRSTSSLKPVKTLTKSSSLKSGRPTLMKKKNSRGSLCAKQNVNRATCSSTLKDSKFPAYVMLNPGGTEAEGTSVMKVCPYTYCSLNGHHHHGEFPPLKQFLLGRRRLMKTQKSMRLKALSPPIEKERKKEIDTGQKVFIDGDPGVIDEVNTLDFFVKIYAPPRGNEEAVMDFNSIVNLSVVKDGADETKLGNVNGGGEIESQQPDELSCSDMSFEDDLDHSYDLMEAERDLSVVSSEHNQEELVEDGYNLNGFVQAEMDLEGYGFADGSKSESHVESDLDELMDSEDEKSANPFTFADDELDTISKNIFCEEVSANEEQEMEEGENNGSSEAGSSDSDDSDFNDGDRVSEIDSSSDLSTNEFGEPASIEEEKDDDLNPDNFVVSSTPPNQFSLEEPAIEATNDFVEGPEAEKPATPIFVEYEQQWEEKEFRDFAEEIDSSIARVDADAHAQGEHVELGLENIDDCAEKEEADAKGSNGLIEVQVFDSSLVLLEINEVDAINEDQCEAKDQNISNAINTEDEKSLEEINHENDQKDVEDGKIGMDAAKLPVIANEINNPKEQTNAKCDSNEKLSKKSGNWIKPIRCKRPSNESEEARKLNWMEPNYLSAEPDAEAEKVDLKHQMIDERKNAEEWMLDYALRQTVNKLAPARKKKVALLVEAFETVAPLPKWEARFRHTTNEFARPRFIQACS